MSEIHIYDPKIEKILQGQRDGVIFSLPKKSNRKSIYNSPELVNYFNLSFVEHKLIKRLEVEKRKMLFYKHLGITNQKPEILDKGNEVKIHLTFPDKSQFNFYVFIETLKLVIINQKGIDETYYLYTPEIILQITSIYKLLAESYPNYSHIGLDRDFFEETLIFHEFDTNDKIIKGMSCVIGNVEFDSKTNGEVVDNIKKKKRLSYYNTKTYKYENIEYFSNSICYFALGPGTFKPKRARMTESEEAQLLDWVEDYRYENR